jgi:DNA-directed RNA polymerase subunit RPC12/RpoP
MKIKVYCQTDKSDIYDLAAHVFSQQERTKRSLVRFFSFIALAVASILIPVFHFVLVPLFLILAPFLSYKTYKEEVVLESCSLPCPECKQTASFAKTSGQWPLHNNCPHCRHRIYFDTVI